MNRSTKKWVYGLGYVVVFGLIVVLVFVVGGGNGSQVKPGMTGEEVGPQERLFDLQTQDVEVFRLGADPHPYLSARVLNPNAGYGASRFQYIFLLFNLNNELVGEVRGEANVLPGGETYLFEIGEDVLSRDVERARVQISNVEWSSGSRVLSPVLDTVSDGVVEVSEGEEIRVKGRVRNGSPDRLPQIRVVSFLRDSFGFRVFAVGSRISNIRGLSEKDFSLLLPYDDDLARRVEGGSVEFYFYPVL